MSGEDDEAGGLNYPDEDQETLDAIAARIAAGGTYPEQDVIESMELTLRRLAGAAALMEDVMALSALRCARNRRLRSSGLIFLAGAIMREAERLYRLYHGRVPE